jgi:hypothetical protein
LLYVELRYFFFLRVELRYVNMRKSGPVPLVGLDGLRISAQ